MLEGVTSVGTGRGQILFTVILATRKQLEQVTHQTVTMRSEKAHSGRKKEQFSLTEEFNSELVTNEENSFLKALLAALPTAQVNPSY